MLLLSCNSKLIVYTSRIHIFFCHILKVLYKIEIRWLEATLPQKSYCFVSWMNLPLFLICDTVHCAATKGGVHCTHKLRQVISHNFLVGWHLNYLLGSQCMLKYILHTISTSSPPQTWNVDTRKDWFINSYGLYQNILALPFKCHSRNLDKSEQATFFPIFYCLIFVILSEF